MLDEDAYLKDIVGITCLLLEEGGAWHFIHTSVQEYHAASFVRSLSPDGARKFYQAMLGPRCSVWQQELDFLAEIDRYRFLKWFHIPAIEEIFGKIFACTPTARPKVNMAVFRRWCNYNWLRMNLRQEGVVKTTWKPSIVTWLHRTASPNILKKHFGDVFAAYETRHERLVEFSQDEDDRSTWIPVEVFFEAGILGPRNVDLTRLRSRARQWFDALRDAKRFVEVADRKTELLDF